MSIAYIIGICFPLALVLLLAYAATRPSAFRTERSTSIAAPPDAIFPEVNDFRSWTKWSPWEGMDPSIKRSYEGAGAGVGAVYHYAGNNKVGEGRLTIERSDSPSRIEAKLEFIKPFVATNRATFTFESPSHTAGPTKVTWTMAGNKNFLFRLVGVFIDTDEMVGKDFERGLASLKALAEAKATAAT